MKYNILTLFPEMFAGYLGAGILGRAQEEKLIDVNLVNIRDFGDGKHKVVDDTPYGGGPGMVLKIEPIAKALEAIKTSPLDFARGKPPAPLLTKERGDHAEGVVGEVERRTVVLSARGKQFTQAKAQEYAQLDNITLICGRYEGIDQRVADHLADEEISIGPYVLNGGEVAAMAVIEAAVRLIPGVLGNEESLREESYKREPHTALGAGPLTLFAEYPHYTKPEEYRGWRVPEVLLSGDHGKIKEWRAAQR